MNASVSSRFAFTLVANVLRAGLNLGTAMLLARWLEPAQFGNMAFLLGTFMGVRQLLDLGSSSAFFTFLSQRPRSARFVRAFWYWMSVQFLAPLLVVGLLFPQEWIELIWRGESRGLVLLAFLAVFMQYSLWPVAQQIGEAKRETLRVQAVGGGVALVHLLAMAILWSAGVLGMYAVFLAILLEYALATVVITLALRTTGGEVSPEETAAGAGTWRMYFVYCWPLVPYALFGFLYEFMDRWMLQRYGGAHEQAYYAVAAQFGAIALLATNSILKIFWKEIAEAHHQGDHARVHALYFKVSRFLYFVSAAIAGFLVPWSGTLLQHILGPAYSDGAVTLAIMFVYPVHQALGQIGGTMLYATEQTLLQVKTGMLFMGVSMMATYLLIAPRDAAIPGLGFAADGMALKMVVMQILQVNLVAFLIARLHRWRFDWGYQPLGLIGCVLLGWLAHRVSMVVSLPAGYWWLGMVLGGLLYTAALTGVLSRWPMVAGLAPGEIHKQLQSLTGKLSARFVS
jgi:O-antigen/teichoic acid export membrane protein